jgi:hypothetical protein
LESELQVANEQAEFLGDHYLRARQAEADATHLRTALERELREPHRWCEKGADGHRTEYVCGCGKDDRDRRIRKALATAEQEPKV